ncbi:MAG: methyl-accepting chemotaxis protein [Treponemataceae bacterium]|nr:methyl-accepting chemotaxis protein [Treponemataceae bacterium]
MKKIRFTLKFKLILLMVGLLLISIIALGSQAIGLSKLSLTEATDKTLSLMAESVCYQIEEIAEKEFSILEGLASVQLFQDPDVSLEEKCAQLSTMTNLDKSKYENIAFYDENGDSYLADGTKRNFSTAAYFQGAMAGRRWSRPPQLNEITGTVLTFFSVPVKNESGKVVGVLVSILNGNPFMKVIQKIDVGGGMHPIVINLTDGSYVALADEVGEGQEESQYVYDPESEIMKVFNRVFTGESGVASFFNPMMNMQVTASYRPIHPENPFNNETPWTVMCTAPYEAYFGRITSLNHAIIFTVLVFGLVSGLITLFVIRVMLKPLLSMKSSIKDIASGNADLTKRIELSARDEVGDVVSGFNQFTEKLQTIMTQVKGSKENLLTNGSDLEASSQDTIASIEQIIATISDMENQLGDQNKSVQETAGAVNEIASNIESLERMIDTQGRGIMEATSAVEEMMGNINSVNISVDKMASSFQDLATSANNGTVLQSDASERIEQIRSQSETLVDANIAIAAIAEQTNLLAMNAAIEAAHAGEAGKGFSVVADEIRKLSETSSQQSRTIGEQLNNIRSSIEKMVEASVQSSNAFQQVSDKISETDELVRQIKGAMEEQTIGSQQIGQALKHMNDSTSEVHAASQEMSAGNDAILQEVQKLQNATLKMKESMDEVTAGARKANETGVVLRSISDQMKEAISDIGEQVDQFIV